MLIAGSGLDIFSLHIFDVSPSRSSSCSRSSEAREQGRAAVRDRRRSSRGSSNKIREQSAAAVVGVKEVGSTILEVTEGAASVVVVIRLWSSRQQLVWKYQQE